MMRWCLLAVVLVACGHDEPLATITGRMERGGRFPVQNIDVTVSFTDDADTPRQFRARSDFAGRFTMRVPGDRLMRFTAVYAGDTLADQLAPVPASGTLALAGAPQQQRYLITAVDEASVWGRAFNALADQDLQSALRSPLLADSITYRAGTAIALARVREVWASTRIPVIRQGVAATLLLAGPRFVASSDAEGMLGEMDGTSTRLNQVHFAMVFRRAYARARFDAVPASKLSRNQAFQTTVRAALDSVLADARTTPAVRASIKADRLPGTGFRPVH